MFGAIVEGTGTANAILGGIVDIIDLETLDDPNTHASMAQKINNKGQVVGSSTIGLEDHPVLWAAGKIIDLGQLDGKSTTAWDINDSGQVVGFGGEPSRAFLWEDGNMADLGTLGGAWSMATSINAWGCIVGIIGISEEPPISRGFIRWPNGNVIQLGTLGGHSSRAWGVNNWAQVVGSSGTADGVPHAFLWQGGKMIDLVGPPSDPATRSGANAINDHGQIVGYIRGSWLSIPRAVMWEAGKINMLLGVSLVTSSAVDINNLGQVVGVSPSEPDETHHAFLWENGKTSKLGALYGDVSVANGINDLGQVVGASPPGPNPGLVGGWFAHAVLWRPRSRVVASSLAWSLGWPHAV